jgi:fatty acid-binding protein DegV
MGLAIICKYFFKNIEKIKNIEKLIHKITNLHHKIKITTFLWNLNYLNKSGRIWKKKLMLGKLLGICPIFNMENWEVVVDKKIIFSNYIKKKQYLIKELEQSIEKEKLNNLFVLYTDMYSKKRAKKFHETIKTKLNINEKNIKLMSLNKAIWVHIWPWSWGIIYN